MSFVVEPTALSGDNLPTKCEVFQLFLHLDQVKKEAKEWNQNTSLAIKALSIADDVAAVWDKAGIPHSLVGRNRGKRVETIVLRARALNKVPVWRNKTEEFTQKVSDLQKLFDVAKCQCDLGDGWCSCAPGDQVPSNSLEFLKDQRAERKLTVAQIDRAASLRSGAARDAEDRKRREEMTEQLEQEHSRAEKRQKREEKKMDTALMQELLDDLFSDEASEDGGDDSEDDSEERERNTKQLPEYARACDRWDIEDRAAADLGTSLLRDYLIVTLSNTFHMIDRTKIKNQRLKYGMKKLEQIRSNLSSLHGLYTDGKRCSTLVRKETTTKVAVPGARGPGASKNVTTTSNQFEIQDHYPVVAMPGNQYITHITPENGTGKCLAKEMAGVARETGMTVKLVGMDGCPVNTGKDNGAIRLFELDFSIVVQWIICGLHLNELLWWHILEKVDGPTSGPHTLSGKVGQQLSGDIWLKPVVRFKPIEGNVPDIPEEVAKQLSRDQNLAYRYAHAVQSGVMPEGLATQVISDLDKSRWITCGVRVLCLLTRTPRPCKVLLRLASVVLNLYFAGWFRYRHRSHIQDGSPNFFHLVKLSRGLQHREDTETAQKVLQHNGFWAHGENVCIAMLADEREEIRRKAALWILRARREFSEESHPRQFVPPLVNFAATDYTELVDWDKIPCTEPPITMGMSEEEILAAIETPLHLDPYPNHTQQIEQMVKVVTDAAKRRANPVARDCLIVQKLESRKICSVYDSKKAGLAFLNK